MENEKKEHEPTDAELKRAERLANKLEKKWQSDILEIRKSLTIKNMNDDDE